MQNYSPNTYWPPPGAVPIDNQDPRVYGQQNNAVPPTPMPPNLPLGNPPPPPPGVQLPEQQNKTPWWMWVGGIVLVGGAGYGLFRIMGGSDGIKTWITSSVKDSLGVPKVEERSNPIVVVEDEVDDDEDFEDDDLEDDEES